MSTTTAATFNLERFVRATEERDAATQVAMYAEDATVTITDVTATPSHPRVLAGRAQIREWIEDLTSRDMTHLVGHVVQDATGAAYTVNCRYPDGLQVVCSSLIELSGEAIRRQSVVQVWDEA